LQLYSIKLHQVVMTSSASKPKGMNSYAHVNKPLSNDLIGIAPSSQWRFLFYS